VPRLCVRDEASEGATRRGVSLGAGDGCTPSEMMALRVFSSRTIALCKIWPEADEHSRPARVSSFVKALLEYLSKEAEAFDQVKSIKVSDQVKSAED
jgi:hypothetical protein